MASNKVKSPSVFFAITTLGAVLHRGFSVPSRRRSAVLAAHRNGSQGRWPRNAVVSGLLRACPLFLLLFMMPRALADRRVIELPYRSVNSYLLVDAKINGSPVRLLVDTGTNKTILNAKSFCRTELNVSQPVNRGAGIVGNALRLRVDLELAHQVMFSQSVAVMNLEELSRAFHIQFDGLLGQDILNQFRSVRIDYKKHVIELEQ